ncbi:MAG: hypothetical protein M0Q92_15770 [Methanoregula sp.]|jgi:hypothetical protein|nr:hypothetical protein [Methanoregula sp.]
MTKPAIATIRGLMKSGLSGAGGDPIPLMRIRRDIFQLTNMLYELIPTGAYAGQDPKESMIIDIEYDGYRMEDPHSARPMSFVTDDPGKVGKWLGTFKAPNAGIYGGAAYSGSGTHRVKISVAPRTPPLTQMHTTIVVPKDGATKTVTTTTITKVPVYDSCGKLTGYEDKSEYSTVDVPIETEITYEGYSVTQIMAPRDFSREAGGAVWEGDFEIYPVMDAQGKINDPRDPVPEVQD